MDSLLLRPAIQRFIEDNLGKDVVELLLKYKEIEGVPISEVVPQLQGKQKAKTKLPTWFSTPNILFPPVISVEQSSSEATAKYKAELMQGKTLIDLTGGFGVDTWAFSKRFEMIHYVECNSSLAKIAEHNFKALGVDNVTVHSASAEYLLSTTDKVDAIYIDPARRNSNNQKVFYLKHCEPNVIELLPQLLKISSQILVKTSPLLDIKLTIESLPYVKEIHVISVNNECKEVLYYLNAGTTYAPSIFTININNNDIQQFNFSLREEADAIPTYSQVGSFLYEPNSAILKAGAFNRIGEVYKVNKLQKNSHLYTSNILMDHFPGRKFTVIGIEKYDRKAIASLLKTKKANVTARNFPDKVDLIRKKLKLEEGGNTYLFATTGIDNRPIIIVCEKV